MRVRSDQISIRRFVSVCFILLAITVCAGFFSLGTGSFISPVSAESSADAIDRAMYSRQEFFGAEAIVPLPTSEARANLSRLAEAEPANPAILEKLSELDEESGDFGAVETHLKALAAIDKKHANDLVLFYGRRGRYEDEAKALRNILSTSDPDERPSIFEWLINIARVHDLKQYLRPDFYHEVMSENGDFYPVFEKLIQQLIESKSYDEALGYIRQAETQFPDQKAQLQQKEIEILNDLGRGKEAEKIYIAAFDPFWSDRASDDFYQFLSDRDRLREYGAGLKQRFKTDPGDFDAAVRLAHYRRYQSDDISYIFVRLQSAKKNWTTGELLTATRFLLRENNVELASRFLYTLYNRPELKNQGELRARVLYQLFEIFSDAQNQRLPLTKGDLHLYREIATVDTDPGIATGILSLLFADTDPSGRLREKEEIANGYFNSAAAYRVFLAYKEEAPTSPELAQMYLDIVRLYTAIDQREIARQALAEFTTSYKKSSDFRVVALKLADAFVASKDIEKSRDIFREILASYKDDEILDGSEKTVNTGLTIPQDRNIRSLHTQAPDPSVHDTLGENKNAVGYGDVLGRLVDSLAKDKRVPEILALYSQEIGKHSQAEWLYEARLKWLEQTNLTEEQLAAYREALSKFQSASWSDKLARWFLKNNRQADFEQFSTEMVGKLDEQETQRYLSEFIDSKVTARDFEKALYLKLYLSALSRFPHDPSFVTGLLKFYAANEREDDWRKLAATYFFEMPEVRRMFLDRLAAKNELRNYFAAAQGQSSIYKLFRADASVRLSDFENAVVTYRELDRLYPNTPDFIERLITLQRSLGQQDEKMLSESAEIARSQADFEPSSSTALTRSGEIYAELGDFGKSRHQWERLIETAAGDKDTYLDTATVYWDYYQYTDALRIIRISQTKFKDDTLCAFEAGAIHESLHETEAAINEYVKALASDDDEQTNKAVRRLVKLAVEKHLAKEIDAAFASEDAHRSDSSNLELGYARYLADSDRKGDAERFLDSRIVASSDRDFVELARDFYGEMEIPAGERTALKRLSEISETQRAKIKYSLELAGSLTEAHMRDEAKAVIAGLVAGYPNNFGVVLRASDLFQKIGFDSDSVDVLKNALARSTGDYKIALSSKLSRRLVQLDRLDEAEQELTGLHGKDPSNLEIFHELAGVYVRKSRPDLLQTAFRETIAALKESDADRREIDSEIAELRTEMIDAFTKLQDYRSAIDQHIEIINREPDDQALVDDAIVYAKRYGGGDVLLAYYRKTAGEAFKNYRWNVVLARIFEANGDIENAVRQYQAAIVDQPEMAELYLAIADLETGRKNFDAALKNIDTALELTNGDPAYLRKKIEILEKAGRMAEANAEKAKLPAGQQIKRSDEDQWSQAEKLRAGKEKAEAREAYRKAFAVLMEKPLEGDLTAAAISGYVQSVREEEPLDKIDDRLWILRNKLVELSDEPESTTAGEARKRRSILEGVMIETVGGILKTVATDEEEKAVYEDLSRRIESASDAPEGRQTVSLILNISRRSGFGILEEKVLTNGLAGATAAMRDSALKDLVNFYDTRGAYAKSMNVIEQFGSDDFIFVAEHARLAGQSENELAALRSFYSKPGDKLAAAEDPYVTRYLDILYANNREELATISGQWSTHQLQLINFLLGKGEGELVHKAIESMNLPSSWKLSRHAETSLALREYSSTAECYFCDALQLDSIGGLLSQSPDKQKFLVADDWFRLSREYGEWLYRSPRQGIGPSLYLAALTEIRPRSADEQDRLGAFYLDQKDPKSALEHFRMAYELAPGDTGITTDLGAAYFLAGGREAAADMWKRALETTEPSQLAVFFGEMSRFGLAREARDLIPAKIVGFLTKEDIDNSPEMEGLIRQVSASFDDKTEQAAYFEKILEARPTDTSLAEFLITESLIAPSRSDPFYQRLIGGEADDDDYDYEFKNAFERAWSRDDVESVFDQEHDYETAEPENRRFQWQRKYIESLIDRHENQKAQDLIASVEKELRGRFARPAWLRLARLRLEQRGGHFDLAEAELFIGVTVVDAVADIKPPGIERYNDLVAMLRAENDVGIEQRIAEGFFARNLALGKFDAVNFDGLARAEFRKKNAKIAIRLLQLMIEVGSEETRPAALSEVARMDIVKARTPDKTRVGDDSSPGNSQSEALELAARTSLEFGNREAAISFRRDLLDSEPSNFSNRFELARLLAESGDRSDAMDLLRRMIGEPTIQRADRWRAKWQLKQLDPKTAIPAFEFDAFSQFYNGLEAVRSDQKGAEDFFVSSLIASNEDKDAAEELAKLYAKTGRQFAALRLAESIKQPKSDAFLDILSRAAEEIRDYPKALSLEKAKTGGGNPDRIFKLEHLSIEAGKRAADLVIDQKNTRDL